MRNAALQMSLPGLALVVCVGLYLFHFSLIWKHAVDVPYEDEWASFESNQLPIGLSLGGLVAQHNEHRLATTRLLIWLQYRLNGWNLAIHQKANFIIYALILVAVYRLLASEQPSHVGLAVLCFLVYLLSPINHKNHFMGYQSQIHFWLLFFFLACYFLFRDPQNWLDTGIGAGAAVLSMYSLAGGVVSGLVLLMMFGLLTAVRVRSCKDSERYAAYFFHAGVVLALMGGAAVFWLSAYSKPSYHPALVWPYELKFWSHFLNIVALGFGFDRMSNMLGVFCLLVVLLPMVGSISEYKWNLSIGLWRSLTLTLAVLGVLASVSLGRAGFGIEQAKESRNFELAMPLLPLSVVHWSVLLQKRKSLMVAAITGLWVVFFFAFFDNWQQFKYYKREAIRRQIGLKCLKAYYEHKGDGNCPTIFPVPLPARLLQQAKALNVSFYRGISAEPGNVITDKNLHLGTEPQLKGNPVVTR
jgi:hypothetical protein